MTSDSPAGMVVRPGLIWGFDFVDGVAHKVDDVDLLREVERPEAFRWLHLNLADQRTRRWLGGLEALPPKVRDLLLSPDAHQRAVVEQGVLGGVLQDIERDFDDLETRVGVLRFAAGPTMMITVRAHPLRSGDVLRQRILSGGRPCDACGAVELLLGAMTEVVQRIFEDMDERVQAFEDALLKDASQPDSRDLINMRSLAGRLHRMLSGMRTLFRRLEENEDLPPELLRPISKFASRLGALDGDLLSTQGHLRLLREELDLQATQRTNQNLYILSMLSALMLPATLVTGIFGMNTGGLALTHSASGTFVAILLAGAASLAVYVLLRLMGFVRR